MRMKRPLAWPLAAITLCTLTGLLAIKALISRTGRLLSAVRLAIGLSALSLGLLAGTAQAASVRFSFAIDFTNSQTAFGNFEVARDDCAAMVCSGTFTPSGPANPIIGPTGTLLAFNVAVDGVTFTESGDDGFPDFSSVALEDNVLTRIDYMDLLGGPPSLTVFGSSSGGWGGEYRNEFFDSWLVENVRQIGGAQLIPEPATLLLLAGALVACVSTSRRRLR